MKKIIKFNIFSGIILIITGIFLEFKTNILEYFKPSTLNLNLNQIDTFYNNDSSLEKETDTLAENTKDLTWAWPTTSNYYLSTYYSDSHPAIDIVPTDGNLNIYAASSGTVITNSYKWDGGNYLIIKQDNGYYSLYCHLSNKLVNEGDIVNKGQLIGIMGMTGHATGIHLHYSIWTGYPYYGSRSINPLNFY